MFDRVTRYPYNNAHEKYTLFWVSSCKMIKTIKHAFTMSQRLSLLLLILTNLLIPIAILIFATGFFPYKPFIPGRATFQHSNNGRQLAPAPFDKLIFMVVDALRRLTPILHTSRSFVHTKAPSDFVYSYESGFSFTQA